jgi:uncharacterized protein YyaL (SSP411 family)
MSATQAMTSSGGWPMSVFLTPDLNPFFAGTYFPPEDGYGRPGFKTLISQIAQAYKKDRDKIYEYSGSFANHLQLAYDAESKAVELGNSIIVNTINGLMGNYDRVNGGFGDAPKFPHPTDMSFLLRAFKSGGDKNILKAVEHTLKAMARGGIYDQIGGGFHRYATDARWLVPHFEKMLYDNALLAVTYSEAYQITKDEFYQRIARGTLDFLIREMRHEMGGFYSAIDADSEGEEGKFYVWNKSEVDRLLKENSEIFCSYYNISETGNFENNTNIPNLDASSIKYRERTRLEADEFDRLMAEQEKILLAERSDRVRPFTDDKIITSWNGLAISGFSKGYQISKKERYRDAALNAARFIKDSLYHNGRLIHSFRKGKTSGGDFLEDYAFLIQGLIDLYETVYDYEWIRFASVLADDAIGMFADSSGNLFLSPANQSDHFIRPKDIGDGAIPAPGSILIMSLLRLADIAGNKSFREKAELMLSALSNSLNNTPIGMTSAVSALDYVLSDKIELVLVGKINREAFIGEVYDRYMPNRVIVVSDNGEEKIPLLEGRQFGGTTVAYVCKNSTCDLPAASPKELKKQLEEL